ncbi:MAG: hypothetical protein P8J87_14135 [Verrucomicrobiales bacterium]|nr:hypothetical protein [Verrucomicrobiales bacterium]
MKSLLHSLLSGLLLVLGGCAASYDILTAPSATEELGLHLQDWATGEQPDQPADVIEVEWVQVSVDPLTLYPKDHPTDASTSHHEVEWVLVGPTGTRMLIPKKGTGSFTATDLRRDALARRAVVRSKLDRSTDFWRSSSEKAIEVSILTAVRVALTALKVAGTGPP